MIKVKPFLSRFCMFCAYPRPRSGERLHTGIIPFSCPRMFSGESCLRCRVCFVCFEGWFFERVIKNIMPVYC